MAAIGSAFGATPDAKFDNLRTAVRTAYQQRDSLLSQSKGAVALNLEVRRDEASLDRLKQGYSGKFGLDPTKLRLQGSSAWKVQWYKAGKKLRYDMDVPPPPEGNDYYLPASSMRIATDAEKGIYYDVANNQAYINLPPNSADNLAGLANQFDVSKLYFFMGKPMADQLDGILSYPSSIEITAEDMDGMECLKLNYLSNRDSGGGRTAVKKGHWVFAPSMGFSLVAAEFTTERFFNGQPAGTSSASYGATYVESSSFPGVWLLKTLRVEETGSMGKEVLSAEFEETLIGQTIQENVFSFEGLGVPYGTVLHDKRFPGLTADYVFGPNQTVSLDEITIKPAGGKYVENLELATVEPPPASASDEPLKQPEVETSQSVGGGRVKVAAVVVVGAAVVSAALIMVRRNKAK